MRHNYKALAIIGLLWQCVAIANTLTGQQVFVIDAGSTHSQLDQYTVKAGQFPQLMLVNSTTVHGWYGNTRRQQPRL